MPKKKPAQTKPATHENEKPIEVSKEEEYLNDLKRLQADFDNYKKRQAEAEKSLAIGESVRDKSISAPVHAAWMIVCSMILNLDESLTQH